MPALYTGSRHRGQRAPPGMSFAVKIDYASAARARRHARRMRVLGWVAYCLGLLVFVLVGSELFLRLLLPAPQGYHVWPPYLHAVFNPTDEATPGISGPGHFIVNGLGLRADEPWPDRQRTVYVFGGSTTADVYLDQDEAWVHLLQTYLNEKPGQKRTWVGNLARSSLASLHNLLQFQYLMPDLPRADLFVDLIGVNDLQLALKSSYLPEMTDETHLSWTFAEMPPTGLLGHFAVARFYERMMDWRRKAAIGAQQNSTADGFVAWRRCRQTAPAENLVQTLPDLTEALAGYRRNLNLLVDRAAAYGAPIVFLTQPAMWQATMDPADAALLLAGGVGPNGVWCSEQRYYAPSVLAEGLERYNRVTLEVCRERGLFCIDLAKLVPKSRATFYDDMHYNEQGARAVARAVADALAAHFPQGIPSTGISGKP